MIHKHFSKCSITNNIFLCYLQKIKKNNEFFHHFLKLFLIISRFLLPLPPNFLSVMLHQVLLHLVVYEMDFFYICLKKISYKNNFFQLKFPKRQLLRICGVRWNRESKEYFPNVSAKNHLFFPLLSVPVLLIFCQ